MTLVRVDEAIIGGGAAGLWLLDELTQRGRSAVILENHALGSGQTVASQGIIHGGLKYTLKGLLNPAAEAIREMPGIWRDSLAGTPRPGRPDLSRTALRSPCCYLWRTESMKSRLGMIGARAGLRIAPVSIDEDERPPILADCPGSVARLDEPVIDPVGFLADLAGRHAARTLLVGESFEIAASGGRFRLTLRDEGSTLQLDADRVILTAGEGNADLLATLGHPPDRMQRRPLHMTMLRGEALPRLFGHCVDGAKTRVTVTTAVSRSLMNVWQVGGQCAEDGVSMEPMRLIAHVRRELCDVIPGFDAAIDGWEVEWSTHRVNRAEAATSAGNRPDDASVLVYEPGVIAAWPTKLALAPRLADRVIELLPPSQIGVDSKLEGLDWPRPRIALPPWEQEGAWIADRSVPRA